MKILCQLTAFWVLLVALDLRGEVVAEPFAKAISFDQLGTEAQKQYTGEGIAITATKQGAHLRAAFQRLEGEATPEGLWLSSAAEISGKYGQFRVLATAVGRSQEAGALQLPATGRVQSSAESVVFTRPGLLEEYRVSMDGVRQDFVVLQRPAGAGALRVTLEVTGAQVTAIDYGVKLTLPDSGREIGYSRLHVTDATGRELQATLEVAAADRIAVCVEDAAATYPVRIDPTFSDADWVSLNPGIGTNGLVYAMAVDGSGNLYAGGSFTLAGGATVSNIAKWDGSVWSAIGSGVNGTVLALTVNGTDVYAGGSFTTAGGLSACKIAKWDGSVWSALGVGANSDVNAIAVMGGNVYAGGSFTAAGAVLANYIAKWDGSAWSALGTGMDSKVYALAVMGTDLYAGGMFTTAGGSAASCVAKWNGSAWSALGDGLTSSLVSGGPSVNALIVSGTTLYAGGNFTRSSFRFFVGNVARWDGSVWTGFGLGTSYPVQAMALSGADLYVVGIPSSGSCISKWNGSSWAALGTGLTDSRPIVNANALALALIGSDLYVGGAFNTAGGLSARNVAKWDGSAWWSVPMGINASVRTLVLSGSSLYAGGGFTSAGGIAVNRVAKWDGLAWTAFGAGMNGMVNALLVNGSDVYAGGSFTTAGGVNANGIAKWDGSAWSALGEGMGGVAFPNVLSLAMIGTDLYVGGSFTTAGGVNVNNIAKWDGNAWSALDTGVGGSPYQVAALAVIGTNLYAGGTFSTAGGVTTNNIAKWNGTAWSALGGGVGSSILALAVSGTNLYAGGYSTSINKWDGSSWSNLPPGPANPVFALLVSGTNLYVGELFSGSPSSNCIAKWDGNTWSVLGSGIGIDAKIGSPPSLNALAVDASNHLFVGGSNFTTVGNNIISPYLAQANLPAPVPDIAVTQAAALSDGVDGVDFGPVTAGGGSKVLTFTLTNPGDAELNGLSLSVDGVNAADYAVSGPTSASFIPGDSVTFTVTFTPGAMGASSAALHIASNVGGTKSPFDIALSGAGVTANQGWQQQYFGVITGTGDAAPDADPNHNGIPNLIEYALGGDPTGGSTRTGVLPGATVNEGAQCLQLNFKRYMDRNDVTLTVQAADDPAGPWTDVAQSTDGSPYSALVLGVFAVETVLEYPRSVTIYDSYKITDPAHPRRFMRLRVSH